MKRQKEEAVAVLRGKETREKESLVRKKRREARGSAQGGREEQRKTGKGYCGKGK